VSERCAVTDTGIERRKPLGEDETILQPIGLGYGKREKT
jgi:hypothetical protein